MTICRHRSLLKAVLLSAVIFAAHPPSATALCTWDVSGQWYVVQGRFLIAMDLKQQGNVVTGTAKNDLKSEGNGRLYKGDHRDIVIGHVDGTVEGKTFNVQIYWPGGLVGVYQGKIGPRGRIEGKTYDRSNPSSNATWYSRTLMRCVETTTTPQDGSVIYIPASDLERTRGPAPALAPRTGKPVGRTSGRSNQSTGGAPAQESGAAGPQIAARSTLVTIPAGATEGTTTITWDGGPNHPYAEVWVKVDDGAETFVVEQGKGSRTVTVQRGKRYLYMLTDSGQRLATVTITAK